MVLWVLVPSTLSHLHENPIYIYSDLSGPHCAELLNAQDIYLAWISPEARSESGWTPNWYARLAIGASSWSVVTIAINARFFTKPQLSPSGVSAGQSMPHWLGCKDLGPLTYPWITLWENSSNTPDKTCDACLRSQMPDSYFCFQMHNTPTSTRSIELNAR